MPTVLWTWSAPGTARLFLSLVSTGPTHTFGGYSSFSAAVTDAWLSCTGGCFDSKGTTL